MSAIPTIVVTPAPPQAWRQPGVAGQAAGQPSFGDTMQQVLSSVEQTGYTADVQAARAISGEGNLTDVVTALSHAELTLQTVTTIRDRVVQAFQDLMKMPI